MVGMEHGRESNPQVAEGPTEKCGVVGIALEDRSVARPLYYSLYALQHRGQESAGIVTHDGFQQYSHVDMGLVGDAFDEGDLSSLNGATGIGHVRYPTEGSIGTCCAQPFSVSFKSGSLGLSHNGNLVNADEIRDELANLGHAFTSDGDTEVIAHDIARNLLDEDLIQAVKHTMERLHGSYSLTIMHDESVIGVRDPQGNRPLCIGQLEDGYVLASESTVIDTLGGELIRDVRPGELIVLDTDGTGYDSYQLVDRDTTAHCFFEHVYFARPDSIVDDELVYDVRRKLGGKLWAESGIDTDVVMPVPDSGRSFASGYAEAANDDEATESPSAAGESAEPGQELANRVHKNRRNLRSWLRRSGVSCVRLYDADIPEYSEFAELDEDNGDDDATESGTIKDSYDEEAPLIDLTVKDTGANSAEHLIGWLKDDEDRFTSHIFSGSEKAYEEALIDLNQLDNWKQASRFIEKEIFARNLVDMYDEEAVDFTDRLQTYFVEYKS